MKLLFCFSDDLLYYCHGAEKGPTAAGQMAERCGEGSGYKKACLQQRRAG